MENKPEIIEESNSISMRELFSFLWKKIWIVAICCIVTALAGMFISMFAISPKYSSDAAMYVKPDNFNADGLVTSQSLVKTYIQILNNRTTLQIVSDYVHEENELNYTAEEIGKMIKAKQIAETEILSVEVTCGDPYHAYYIANAISHVLKERVLDITGYSIISVIDSGNLNTEKVSPSNAKNTILSFVIGGVVSSIIIIIIAAMDTTIHNEEYIIETYDYPILAKIPDLYNEKKKEKYYYNYYSKNDNEEDSVASLNKNSKGDM